MQLTNKYYPYPVIIDGGEYYEDVSFSSEVKQNIEGYNIKLSITTKLNDKKLLEMLKADEVIFAHHIECPNTCYRKLIKSSDFITECFIKDSDVNGIVQICSFIIANTDIEKYTNDSFSKEYMGWKFDIEKGCIMAIGNQYNLRIEKIRDDFINTTSIFSIVKNTDPTANTISFNLSEQKIVILMPETTYKQYSSMQKHINIQPIMHSMIIIPALIYTLSELKNNDIYEYEEKRWFRALRKACKAIDIIIDDENIKKLDIIKTSQLLIDCPISKAVEFCAMGGGDYED